MAEYVIAEKQDLINIADAIREKTETTDGMGIDEMAALIAAIESGGAKVASGIITFDADTSASGYKIETGFSEDENLMFAAVLEFSPSSSVATNDFLAYELHNTMYTGSGINQVCEAIYYGNITRKRSAASNQRSSADTINISGDNSSVFRSGKTYCWFACVGGYFLK